MENLESDIRKGGVEVVVGGEGLAGASSLPSKDSRGGVATAYDGKDRRDPLSHFFLFLENIVGNKYYRYLLVFRLKSNDKGKNSKRFGGSISNVKDLGGIFLNR